MSGAKKRARATIISRLSSEGPDSGSDRVGARRPYSRPRVLVYGDLRTLTLGGSPGMGDSGSTVMIRKPL